MREWGLAMDYWMTRFWESLNSSRPVFIAKEASLEWLDCKKIHPHKWSKWLAKLFCLLFGSHSCPWGNPEWECAIAVLRRKAKHELWLLSDWEAAIRVGVLDCGSEANYETCKDYGVQFYPTFKVRKFARQTRRAHFLCSPSLSTCFSVASPLPLFHKQTVFQSN